MVSVVYSDCTDHLLVTEESTKLVVVGGERGRGVGEPSSLFLCSLFPSQYIFL